MGLGGGEGEGEEREPSGETEWDMCSRAGGGDEEEAVEDACDDKAIEGVSKRGRELDRARVSRGGGQGLNGVGVRRRRGDERELGRARADLWAARRV